MESSVLFHAFCLSTDFSPVSFTFLHSHYIIIMYRGWNKPYPLMFAALQIVDKATEDLLWSNIRGVGLKKTTFELTLGYVEKDTECIM